jgi:hypothetical protein
VRPAQQQCLRARSSAGMGSAEPRRERGRQHLAASCGCARAGHRRAPAGRWDFRRGLKRSPKSPDFKHRHKFYSLWCNERGGLAPWVRERLAALDAAPAGSPKARTRPALAPGTGSDLPGRRWPSHAQAGYAKSCLGLAGRLFAGPASKAPSHADGAGGALCLRIQCLEQPGMVRSWVRGSMQQCAPQRSSCCGAACSRAPNYSQQDVHDA